MNTARPDRPHRRAARGMAAFCALMLVASNALATMGLCVVKAPHAAQTLAVAPVVAGATYDAADEPSCPEHARAAATDSPAQPASAAHCTQDDPGAQVRANDVPPAALDALPVFQRIALASPPLAARTARAADVLPPAPLYARLSRLLL